MEIEATYNLDLYEGNDNPEDEPLVKKGHQPMDQTKQNDLIRAKRLSKGAISLPAVSSSRFRKGSVEVLSKTGFADENKYMDI